MSSTAPCPTCGRDLVDGLCFNCDLSEEVDVGGGAVDPLIGRVIADRYEIRALHGAGGMARIYRAVQRSLGREVVVKVISPELLAQEDGTAEEAVARFMVEAQAASKLNHPNVVSVFDFGRTPKEEGGLLFLVMEFLNGSDLWTVTRTDHPLPIPRIAAILQQVCAALGEAHYVGIAHRDIKPENIILEPRRGGRDLVKVIDFGLAKLGALRSVTRVGQTVGTPSYMAPEQIAGSAIGSSDLYAVGVILFELLTGRLPFEGSPLEILRKHLGHRRPDPREIAPDRGISPDLAAVCMRAMHIDPAQRWPDAESLGEAIVEAAGGADWGRRTVPRTHAATGPSSLRSVQPPAPIAGSRRPALLGRDADLDWAKKLFASADGGAASLFGAPGVGRTRLLAEMGAVAEERGAQVVRFRAAPHPQQEVTFGAARRWIAELASLDPSSAELMSGEAAGADTTAGAGLLAIFSGLLPSPEETRRVAGAALRWAAKVATQRGIGALVVTIDDVDRTDRASRRALVDAFAEPVPECFVVTSSAERLAFRDPRATSRRVLGLSGVDARRLMEVLGGPPDGAIARRTDDAVEPLYVELLRRFRFDGRDASPPLRLDDLVASSLSILTPAQRRLLLTVAITGGGTPADLASFARGDDLAEALGPLTDAGLLERSVAGVRLAHESFGRVVIGTTPAGAGVEIHATAASKLASDPLAVELRTHHALLAGPDFETFMLVEETAATRSAVGDDDGAVSVLTAAVEAARGMLRHGDVEAGGSACVVFGQKLGALLRDLERHEEAVRVLEETLTTASGDDPRRVLILEALARSAGALGRLDEGERWRREALAVARKREDRVAVQRLVALARE